MNTRHLAATALLASALALTGCGGSSDDTDAGSGTGSSTSAETAQGNDADVVFLSGMKPHHEQAVEMSDMVLAADPPAAVAAIARQIKAAQAPEIEQMTTMLTDLGEDAAGGHGGGHSTSGSMDMGAAGHEGTMSDAEMAALDAATGTQAARLYLEGMVRHHQGAIKASDAELADGEYRPALDLARKIKTAQAGEITTMQALLETL
ncbi:MAG: hypothetical protein JWM64_522 [Frankiales bacterium]|nr:hypothetical protein [Frankiales bacterium]